MPEEDSPAGGASEPLEAVAALPVEDSVIPAGALNTVPAVDSCKTSVERKEAFSSGDSPSTHLVST